VQKHKTYFANECLIFNEHYFSLGLSAGIQYTSQQLKQKSVMHFKGNTKIDNDNINFYVENTIGINQI
jgi:hypothetical protein